MRKQTLLSLLLCLAFFGVARAESVTIGTGTANTTNSPYMSSDYKYSFVENIYSASEIGMNGTPCTINTISFNATTGNAQNNDIVVYMKNVSYSSFSNTTWETVSDEDIVFTGTWNLALNSWCDIVLDTPFEYDGSSHLMIAIDENTNASYAIRFAYSTASNTVLQVGSYSSDINPASPGTGTRRDSRANVRLDYTVSGGGTSYPAPTDLQVTLTEGNGTVASLEWTESGEAYQWEICLNNDTANLITTYENPYELTGLTPEMTYTAKVRSVYEDEGEQSAWSSSISFTPTSVLSLTVNEGTVTNSHIPIYGLYVDASCKSQFIIPAVSLESLQYAYIDKMTFHSSTTSCNWGEAEFEIYLTEVSTTAVSAINDWSTMDKVYTGALSISNNQMVITLDNSYQYMGENLMVGVLETNNGTYKSCSWYGITSSSANAAIYGYNGWNGEVVTSESFLPKITFNYTPGEAPSCFKPTGLTATDVTAHTATLSWTDNNETAAWQIQVGENDPIDVTENPYTLTGLNAETDYTVKVRANCGEGDYSDWTSSVSFTTPVACQAPTELTVSDITATTAKVTWTPGTTDQTAFVVAYTTDASQNPDDITNFVTVNATEYSFSSLTAETSYYVYVAANCGTDGYSTWSEAAEFTTPESCPAPRNLAAEELTYYSATISWDDTGADSYTVQVGELGTSTSTETILSEGFEGGQMPTGWSRTGSYWTITSGSGHNNYTGSATGSYNAGCYIGSYSGSDILVTPAMDLSAALSATLDFNFLNTSWGGDINTLNVYYRVNEGDWNLLYTNSAVTNSWEAVPTITLVGFGANYQIGFECAANYSYGMGIDDVMIKAELSSITWTDVDTNASNPFSFDNLDVETTYRVRVFGVCDGEQSGMSDILTFTTPACAVVPTNLAESAITTNSATLSWTGSSDSYLLQYRPWHPAGDDIITTSAMTTYTVDLSAYSGTGSVAIRHYDISDMFQLIVDDIQVTNASGTVVYSQDFESCEGSMPAEFSNMDLDGDGYMWGIASSNNSNVNGTYGIVSASYDNNVGALTPDNWLIVSGIEMGGQMTFQARGQDGNYAAENFAIYVSTENSITEVEVTETSYSATELESNTPYAWQVKGICGEEGSSFASSFFKTKDDILVFATDGNWNEVTNWTDADGNAVTALPTTDNNVRIDADATIPADYVAYANKATIGTGSILIKDGGQLKQNSATLRVTMEKEITGYTGDKDNYYFIASPFNGRTLYEASGSFSHVDNMLTDEYDLYAFDGTVTDGLEWINYKYQPSHIAFEADNGLAGLLYGEGYLYANAAETTLVFEGTTGKSNNYSETKDYTYTDGTSDWIGWALVGNFFTCNAYINYVDADGEVLNADFYTMNSNGDGYDLSESNVGLAPLTGAFINYSATGKVQYSTEAPSKKTGMLNMTVSQNRNSVDQARLRFGEGHNLGKVSFRANSSRLYMPVDGNDYAVVYADNIGEMPLNFKAENNGSYTLSFSNEAVEFSYLHLIDNMTGADVDLLANPSYSFEAKTTDYASRFKLVFATGSSTLNDDFAFVSNDHLMIYGIEGDAILKVTDLTGRTISTESFNGSYDKAMNLSSGVYMLQLIQGADVRTQKIVF